MTFENTPENRCPLSFFILHTHMAAPTSAHLILYLGHGNVQRMDLKPDTPTQEVMLLSSDGDLAATMCVKLRPQRADEREIGVSGTATVDPFAWVMVISVGEKKLITTPLRLDPAGIPVKINLENLRRYFLSSSNGKASTSSTEKAPRSKKKQPSAERAPAPSPPPTPSDDAAKAKLDAAKAKREAANAKRREQRKAENAAKKAAAAAAAATPSQGGQKRQRAAAKDDDDDMPPPSSPPAKKARTEPAVATPVASELADCWADVNGAAKDGNSSDSDPDM